MGKKLGSGRKIIHIEIREAAGKEEGYQGMIVMIEGGLADLRTERAVIDSVRWDSQGSFFMHTEEDGEI